MATATLMITAHLIAAAPLLTRIRESLRLVIQKLRRQYFNRVWQMQIGEGSVVSFSAKLDKTNPRGLHIGKYTVVTFGAAILTHDYVNNVERDVYIGDNCFIGAHALILPGVRIGNNCIVAAATVVARDVPSGCLVAGNPARVVETNVKTTHYGVRVSLTPQEMQIVYEGHSAPSISADSRN
jgi:acetyltransferase-like isoleucine patch superfamily enzyme